MSQSFAFVTADMNTYILNTKSILPLELNIPFSLFFASPGTHILLGCGPERVSQNQIRYGSWYLRCYQSAFLISLKDYKQ